MSDHPAPSGAGILLALAISLALWGIVIIAVVLAAGRSLL